MVMLLHGITPLCNIMFSCFGLEHIMSCTGHTCWIELGCNSNICTNIHRTYIYTPFQIELRIYIISPLFSITDIYILLVSIYINQYFS